LLGQEDLRLCCVQSWLVRLPCCVHWCHWPNGICCSVACMWVGAFAGVCALVPMAQQVFCCCAVCMCGWCTLLCSAHSCLMVELVLCVFCRCPCNIFCVRFCPCTSPCFWPRTSHKLCLTCLPHLHIFLLVPNSAQTSLFLCTLAYGVCQRTRLCQQLATARHAWLLRIAPIEHPFHHDDASLRRAPSHWRTPGSAAPHLNMSSIVDMADVEGLFCLEVLAPCLLRRPSRPGPPWKPWQKPWP